MIGRRHSGVRRFRLLYSILGCLVALGCAHRPPSLASRLQALAPTRNSVVMVFTPSCAIRAIPRRALAALDSLEGVSVRGLYLVMVEPDSTDEGTALPTLGFPITAAHPREWLPAIEAEGYALPLAAVYRHGRLVAILSGDALTRLGNSIPTAFGTTTES